MIKEAVQSIEDAIATTAFVCLKDGNGLMYSIKDGKLEGLKTRQQHYNDLVKELISCP